MIGVLENINSLLEPCLILKPGTTVRKTIDEFLPNHERRRELRLLALVQLVALQRRGRLLLRRFGFRSMLMVAKRMVLFGAILDLLDRFLPGSLAL